MSAETTQPKRSAGKLGAEKLTPDEQRRRFEALAKEAGCDEGSDERFDRALAILGKQRPKDAPSGSDHEAN